MTEQDKEKKVADIAKEAEDIGCPVKRGIYFVDEFLRGPMCGKCFPCSIGSYEARTILGEISLGVGGEEDVRALSNICEMMLVMSRCKRGKDAAKYVLEALDEKGFRAHLEGICPEGQCNAFLEYRVVPGKCTMCGECLEACEYDAIIGEKRKPMRRGYLPFEIRQRRCVKCGDCVKVCPTDAIEIVYIEKEEPVKVS
jgi:NAD-dependent dihydropyrimidine dehydrogenase PreA subunit